MIRSSILLMIVFYFFGCSKAKLNKETTTSEDCVRADEFFKDAQYISEQAFFLNSASGKLNELKALSSLNCATITIVEGGPLVFPKLYKIDFGSSNCMGTDGRNRRGIIMVNFTDQYSNDSAQATITFNDYFVNDYKIEGEKRIQNIGGSSFKVEVINGKIIYPNAQDQVVWNSITTRTQTQGVETRFSLNPTDSCYLSYTCYLDDVYEITGSGDGINKDGRLFDMTITSPLKVQFCNLKKENVSGTLQIQPEDLYLRTLNFGIGTCDGNAVITIRNSDYPINLP
jgi:hypothetical protein